MPKVNPTPASPTTTKSTDHPDASNTVDNAAIVESIAMLGKGLGLPITAEGIESHAVLDQLRGYGELRGQGYLYGQPRSASDTLAWLGELGLLGTAGDADIGKDQPKIAEQPQGDDKQRAAQA